MSCSRTTSVDLKAECKKTVAAKGTAESAAARHKGYMLSSHSPSHEWHWGLGKGLHSQSASSYNWKLKRPNFTFYCYLGYSLDHPEGRHGHTRVVCRLSDICKLQDVPSNGHVVLRSQILSAQHPFNIRHGRADCHTCNIYAASWHYLIVGRRNGESWRHSTHWKLLTKYKVKKTSKKKNLMVKTDFCKKDTKEEKHIYN